MDSSTASLRFSLKSVNQSIFHAFQGHIQSWVGRKHPQALHNCSAENEACLGKHWQLADQRNLFSTDSSNDGELSAWAKKTLHKAQLMPSPDLVSDLYFALLQKPNLVPGRKFVADVSVVAASVAHLMNPQQVALVFEVFCRINWVHAGLLETLADSMISSGDPGCFSTTQLCSILWFLGNLIDKIKRVRPSALQSYDLFPSEKKFADLLLGEIMDCRMHSLTVHDIPRILHVLGLLQLNKKELMERLTRAIEARQNLHRFSHKDLACMLYSLAMMESSDRFTVEILMIELASKKRRPYVSPGDVAMAVYSIGRLGHNHLNNMVGDLSRSLLKPGCIETTKTAELASLVYAYGKLGYCNNHLLSVISTELLQSRRLIDIGGCETVSFLNGISTLGFRSPFVLLAFSRIILQKYKTWTTKELCAVVHALGRLKYRKPMFLRAMTVEIAKPNRLGALQHGDIAILIHGLGLNDFHEIGLIQHRIEEWTTPEKLKLFSERGLCMLLKGLTMCGFARQSVLQNLLSEITQPIRLERISSIGISACIHSLGQAGYQDRKSLGLLGHEVIKLGRRETLGERQIANILYSYGKLGVHNMCVDALVRIMIEPKMLRSFTNQGLVDALYGLSLLKFRQKEMLHEISLEFLHGERLGKLSEKDLALCIYCLGQLEMGDRSILDALMLNLLKRESLKRIDSTGLLQILMGLARVSYDNVHILRQIVGEVTNRQREFKLKRYEVSKVVQALGKLGVDEKSGVLGLIGLIGNSMGLGHFSARDLVRMHQGLEVMVISRGIELTKVLAREIKSRIERRQAKGSVVQIA